MREIARGSDGWYFEHQKIEPTPEEIQAWDDMWCRHCSSGSIMDHKLSCADACATQVPCPACFGTGYKDWKNKYFEFASHAKVVAVSGDLLDPDNFNVFNRITVEFCWNLQGQQDGRPPHPIYERTLKLLHIGRTVLEALERDKNVR